MDAQAASLSDRRERLGMWASVVVGGLTPFLDTLVEPVLCADREWRVLYRNPVFAATWNTEPGALLEVRATDDRKQVVELYGHCGSPFEVILESSTIPDLSGRVVAVLCRVHVAGDDIVAQLRDAAALISARIAALGQRTTVEWSPDEEERVASLSKREREIFDRILDGNRVGTVAADLFLSEHTVRNYLKRIYQKLDVHSLGELRERMGRGVRTTN